MQKCFVRGILAVVAGLAISGQQAAQAEPRGGNFEVSPFVGYYGFDGETGYKSHGGWGGRFGYLYNDNLEAEVSAVAVRTKVAGYSGNADLRQLQVDALYNFSGFGKLVPYAAAGIGMARFAPLVEGGSESAFLIDYGVGARYFFTDNLAARVDLRHPLIFDNAESNYLASVGVSFFFGVAKPPVKIAEAAPAPEPVKVVVAAPVPAPAAAPAPPPDSDGDGVVDSNDRCPGTPAGVPVDIQGCPFDSDGDGVLNYLDKCPDTPRQAKVDSQGCPVDSDGDGVYDYLDKCPDTTAGAPVDVVGCLKDTDRDGLTDWEELKLTGTDLNNPDSDGDGLSDGDEVNKYRTNPLNPDTDGGSVPDGLEVNVANTNPLDPADDVKEVKRIELKVYFDTNSDVVKPEYYPEIEKVADFLKEYAGVSGKVEGHTDSRGAAAYNQNLSERRARNVIKVAEERFGVTVGRLTGAGYGGSRPVADNKSAAGLAKNRRIEAAFTSR
ncbi:MAG: OmpA family protein [Desulfobulbaceae bacterium]|nr:OmpA family protein [Desulfobulbaceae bacterium]